MIREFKGKVAFITGAAGGIGLGLAKAFAAEGMKVAVCDIDAERVAAAAAELKSAGAEALGLRLDVTDRAAWTVAADQVEQTLGPIQMLCNNAGVTAAPVPGIELSPEAWDWVISTNLTGTFNGVRTIVPRMKARGDGGHVLNTASIQALVASPDFAPYNAAKFAVVGLTETLAIEQADSNISFSVLCPGSTRTEIFDHSRAIAPQFMQILGNPRSTIKHSVSPDELAALVLAGIKQGLFYIVTHPQYRPLVEARHKAIEASIRGEAVPGSEANITELEAKALNTYRGFGAAAVK